MFDLGMFELMIIGVLMVLVLGPKELPKAMRAIARAVAAMRRMATEFQGHMDELAREADLQDAREAARSFSPDALKKKAAQALDPTGKIGDDVRGIGEAAGSVLDAPDAQKRPTVSDPAGTPDAPDGSAGSAGADKP